MGKTLRVKSDRRVIGRIERIYGADVNLFKMLIAPRESIRWKKNDALSFAIFNCSTASA